MGRLSGQTVDALFNFLLHHLEGVFIMRKNYFVRAMLLMLLFSVLLVGCKEIPKENDTVKETEEKTIEIPPEQQVEKELISALVYYLQYYYTFYDQ